MTLNTHVHTCYEHIMTAAMVNKILHILRIFQISGKTYRTSFLQSEILPQENAELMTEPHIGSWAWSCESLASTLGSCTDLFTVLGKAL